MKKIITLWNKHGTKMLGTATTIITGFVAIDGLISAEHVKYWLAANLVLGALTVKRGYVNQATQEKLYGSGQ